MRSALVQHELDFGPNMTPMVDIVMVILVFFMGATTFAGAEWFLNMAVPRAAAPGDVQGDPFDLPPARFDIRLRPGEDGRARWRGLGVDEQGLEMLEPMLTALVEHVGAEMVEVVIHPEGMTAYEDVVRAADACAAAGVRVVGLGA